MVRKASILAGDHNITRTIPMSQVKSVQYGEVAAQPQASTEAQPAASVPAKQPLPTPVRESRPESSQPAPLAGTFELPAGTELPVRTNETIDSTGTVVIPRGSQAQLVIASASQGEKVRGASDLVLNLASVTVGGRHHQLDAADVAQRGEEGVGANKRTANYTAGGAALGAIIGPIAGGGKGAAIGAGPGAGAGALTQVLTKGQAIRVPAESVLTFNLESPLRIAAV